MRYLIGFIVIFIIVVSYLFIRKQVDRKKEKAMDIEIVREGEEHLGSWAYKSPENLIKFRLHRNGGFTYTQVQYPGNDTTQINGSYEIIGLGGGRSTDYYPRLIALNEKNDTIFNYFIAYITPYDTKVNSYDKMVLNQKSIYDTAGFTFYRIKQ